MTFLHSLPPQNRDGKWFPPPAPAAAQAIQSPNFHPSNFPAFSVARLFSIGGKLFQHNSKGINCPLPDILQFNGRLFGTAPREIARVWPITWSFDIELWPGQSKLCRGIIRFTAASFGSHPEKANGNVHSLLVPVRGRSS